MILLKMKFELALTAVPLNLDFFNHLCCFCMSSSHEPNSSTEVYLEVHLNMFCELCCLRNFFFLIYFLACLAIVTYRIVSECLYCGWFDSINFYGRTCGPGT